MNNLLKNLLQEVDFLLLSNNFEQEIVPKTIGVALREREVHYQKGEKLVDYLCKICEDEKIMGYSFKIDFSIVDPPLLEDTGTFELSTHSLKNIEIFVGRAVVDRFKKELEDKLEIK